jgi:large subunit ribosomal protein L24
VKSSIQPRKQRRAFHHAPLHQAVKHLRAHLSEELLVKFGKRSATVRVGDTVKVLRGKHAGTSGSVMDVDRKTGRITIEGVSVAKSDGKQKPKPVFASNVVLTKLDLTDKTRRAKLGASEADAEAVKPAKPKKEKEGKPAPSQATQAERQAAKAKAKAEEPEDADEAPEEEKP